MAGAVTLIYISAGGSSSTRLTFEVDSRLNRRAFLILSKSPSPDVNAWEFTGNRCGNAVGIWELDRNFLRSMTSGGAVVPREPRPHDVICHSQTLAPQEPMPQPFH